MKNKALKTLFLYNGIFVFGSSLLGPLYAVFVETIDKNVMSVSLTWFAFLISTTVCLMVLRRYGDRIKEKEHLLLAGYFIRAMVWFIFPLTSTLFMLVVLQLLLGVGEAVGTPAYEAIFAEHLDKGKQVKEYTDWKLISNLVSAFAVLLGGLIVNRFGFNTIFMIMGVLASVAFIGVLWQPRKIL